MRSLVIAALLFVQLVAAVQAPDRDAANGVTVLKPTGGDASKGTTVMAPSGTSGTPSACATGNCGSSSSGSSSSGSSAAPASSDGKIMKPALINRPVNACGCPQEDEACACNKPKFLAPEIKVEPCGCQNSDSPCACRVPVQTTNACGCLHMTECGCRQTLMPETKENSVVPEIRDTPILPSSCGCQQEDTACACQNKPKFTAPEIKADPCACQDQPQVDCACSHFRRNF